MLVRANRTQKRQRGLALFIRTTIPFIVIYNVSHESGTWERISCRSKCKGKALMIDLVCRSSSYETTEVLTNSLNTRLKSSRCIILGGSNASTVGWKNLRTGLSENFFKQELVDVVVTRALVKHVIKATRYEPGYESLWLDLILPRPSVSVGCPVKKMLRNL